MSEPSLHDLSIKIAEIQKDTKAIWKRIDEQLKLATSVQELATRVEIQGVTLNNLVAKIAELVDDLKHIKEKPAKRWETLVGQIISLILAAVVGFFLSKLGM